MSKENTEKSTTTNMRMTKRIRTSTVRRVSLGALLAVTAGIRVACFVTLSTSIRRIRTNRYPPWKRAFQPSVSCAVQTVVPSGSELISDQEHNSSWAHATATLLSFGSEIHNARQLKKREARLKPVRSLVQFLESTRLEGEELPLDFVEAFRATLVSGIRTAGSAGEFRLIFILVEACIQFASLHGPILPPRLFGEAIENLSSRTKANASKIRQMWRLGCTHQNLLEEPLGAFELNTCIKGLASRGKIRSSVDLFRESGIEGDAYTASTLFRVLADSIEDGQPPAVRGESSSVVVSPCWQWNEAMFLLDNDLSAVQLNNYVYSAVLKLNERATEIFCSGGKRHYGASAAIALLERMKKDGISPDVVTCSLILSAFDKGYQWAAAVALLNAMDKQNTTDDGWSLPHPNVYSYAAAVSACARCNQYAEAMNLVNRMRLPGSEVSPNTWVYNAALAACVRPSSSPQTRDESCRTAFALLDLMKEDSDNGLDTAPDTVSYNTILAVMGNSKTVFRDKQHNAVCDYTTSGFDSAFSSEEDIVKDLIAQMKDRGIPRDAITYCNAIKADHLNGESILHTLKEATEDDIQVASKQPKLKGRAAEGRVFVFNAALSVLAARGDVEGVQSVLLMMNSIGIKANSESLAHLLTSMGSSGRTSDVLSLVEALQEDPSSRRSLIENFDDGVLDYLPSFGEEQFSAAISTCLRESDLDSALGVLTIMREKGMSPSDTAMQDIALAYCRLAMDAALDETRREVKKKKRSKTKKQMLSNTESIKHLSRSRARCAYEICMALESPPAHVLSAVSRALSAAGLWQEGRNVLRHIHKAAIKEGKLASGDLCVNSPSNQDMRRVLPGLHRSLLKLCARSGNVTAALLIVDDIQVVSKWFSPTCNQTVARGVNATTPTLSSLLESGLEESEELPKHSFSSAFQTIDNRLSVRVSQADVGMKGEDWKLLLIAASKSGHWKVCISTLQFLRPFLEETNAFLHAEAKHGYLDKKYGKLSRSLTSAILCLEQRSQYAWALRAIDDWITWSGRRPPKDGVFAAIRILAARGRGYEVNSLLSRIVQVPAVDGSDGFKPKKVGISYEQALYIGAMSSLHSYGLYDDADDVFISAVSDGHVDFVITQGQEKQLTLDLHGMNTALAHSAVRVALQREVESASWTQTSTGTADALWERDMVIVTGRGSKSGNRFRPVLRPEVQRMLLEEFYPPLSTTSIPGNMGALRVPAADINGWLDHQRSQKGARILAVADVLKNLSSGSRLRQMIKMSVKSDETNGGGTIPHDNTTSSDD